MGAREPYAKWSSFKAAASAGQKGTRLISIGSSGGDSIDIYGENPILEHRLCSGSSPYDPTAEEIKSGFVLPSVGFKVQVRNEGDLASSIQGALDLLQINETNSLDDNKYVVAPLAKILKGLDNRINALLHEIKQAQSKNDAAVALADTLQQANVLLKEELAKAKQELYGTSSEKIERKDPESDSQATNEDVPEFSKEKLRVIRNTGRKPLPEDLPCVDEVCKLKPEQRKCKVCQQDMTFVGNEYSKILEIVPARTYVRRYITEKYICRCGCGTSVQSKAPKSLIPGSSYGSASVIAEVLTNKYQFALPLDRQTKIFARAGHPINRTTLANLVIQIKDKFLPLLDLFREHLLRQEVIHADETTMQVLKEVGRAPQTKSYIWQYCSGAMAVHPLVLFDYQQTRAGEHALNFLTREDGSIFEGYLQVDGYTGYNALTGVTRMGCMAHIRRKFVEVQRSVPESYRSRSKANEALTLIQELYVIEVQIKGRSKKQRLNARRTQSLPILNEFKRWLDDAAKTAMPQSLLGKAVHYALGQWDYIVNYLDNAELSIDNNIAERSIKAFVIGRKNWLFADTVAGAEANAVISSIIRSAVMNELDPYQYLMAILQKLPYASCREEYEKMLPWVVKDQLALEAATTKQKVA